MEIKLKQLRRIETEIDNELEIQEPRIQSCCRNLGSIESSILNAAIRGALTVHAQYELISALLAKKFEIRAIVAAFNKENGINERTIKIAILEKQITYAEKASKVNIPSIDRDYRTNTISGYYQGITQAVSDDWRIAVRKLRAQIQKLKDSCSGINSNGTVVINNELESFLKDNQFITD